MKTIHFITYNDTYNGVYQSQVIDVVEYLNQAFDVNVKLIAFVPIRLWRNERKKIKSKISSATVLPILGYLSKVKRTSMLLRLFSNKRYAICRGPLAFAVAKRNFIKLTYDGRAAVEAEVTEYEVTGSKNLDKLLIETEQIAIHTADYYIAVSSKLIAYWEAKLGREIPLSNYSIIPCSLTSKNNGNPNTKASDKVKVVYSGGTGQWQSFEKVVNLLDNLMSKQQNLEALFLTKDNKDLSRLIEKYPDRCTRKWLNHEEVFSALSSCDYGILIREDNITNKVASPVKFAEYLNAGLQVLISPNIGDFSEFTEAEKCGIVISGELPLLRKISQKDRDNCKNICLENFMKDSSLIHKGYKRVLDSYS